MRYTLIGLAFLLVAAVTPAAAAPHWEADVSWTQPDPVTQTGYRLERKLGATGSYQSIGGAAPIGPTVRTFRDVGPYQDGQIVCWRVTALAVAGEVQFDEVCKGAPVQLPGKGTMSVDWKFLPN